jgi:hypothetical protein
MKSIIQQRFVATRRRLEKKIIMTIEKVTAETCLSSYYFKL